nr:BspA family leucine-rich repeat surface protein [Mycoplasmopsis bovis]
MLIMFQQWKECLENATKFNSPIFKLVSQKLRIYNICSTIQKEFNNSNISNWNTSSVTDIRSMFRGATKFNQNLNWQTENITLMHNLFTEQHLQWWHN